MIDEEMEPLTLERFVTKKTKVGPAAEKKILHAIERAGGSATFIQIGSNTGTDEITLRRYLATLLHRKVVTFDGVTGKYLPAKGGAK